MKWIAAIIHGGGVRRGSTPRLLRRWLVFGLGIASLGLTSAAWAGATPILVERYLPVPIQGFASCWEFFSRTNDGNKPEAYLMPGFGRCQTSFYGVIYLYFERAETASCPVLPPLGRGRDVATAEGAHACLYTQRYRCPPGYSKYSYSTCRQWGMPVAQKQPPACPTCANPINFASGEKTQRERDYTGAGPAPLVFERFYSSRAYMPMARLGPGWRHSYDRRITVGVDDAFETAFVARPDGRVLYFTSEVDPDDWQADPDVTHRLYTEYDATGVRAGLRLVLPDDTVERYDAQGYLHSITPRGGQTLTVVRDELNRAVSISDPYGRSLLLDYDASDRLVRVTDPAGQHYAFAYDDQGRLVSVRYPDDTPAQAADDPVRVYHYENEIFPAHLTGITNENGVRYATWAYDASGRAIASEHAGGVDRVTVAYGAGDTRTVTDALGAVRNYTLRTVYGVQRVVRDEDGLCDGCGGIAETEFDVAGFVSRRTDRDGHVSTYIHDERGLETRRTEAVGTRDERTIETQWHPEYKLPVRIAEPGRVTTFTYDTEARLLTHTTTDPATGRTRTTRNTYGPDGLLTTVDGPRTDVLDVSRFEHSDGVMVRAVNALGHVSEVTAHDPHGRPLSVVDPNGLVTLFDYDERGRLLRETVDVSATQYVRDAVGNVVQRIQADGVAMEFVHDVANRLVAVVDARRQRLEYTLDAAGNRTLERIVDTAGEVTWERSQSFDALGRLVERISGAGQLERFEHDARGNVIAHVDGRGYRTERSYGPLNRLRSVTDALGGVTSFAYDARDNLVAVTDSRGLTTRYVFDGLDNLLAEESPDSGAKHYVSDDAGNRVLVRDARGVETRYTYDSLGRVLDARNLDPSEDVTYAYDTAYNGVGRLASVSDMVGTTTHAYDLRGNISAETRELVGERYTIEYAYDRADRLAAITYPSGARVDYSRNDLGRVSGADLTLDGATMVLATGIEYQPFGAPVTRAFGNGLTETLEYDAAGRLIALTTPGVGSRSYWHDASNNIMQIDDGVASAADQRFEYDALGRLTAADGRYGELRYGYDALGNRTRRTSPDGVELYDYDTESNRLLGVTGRDYGYDAAGNVIVRGEKEFDYDAAGRLQAVRVGGVERARYGYNARGERSVRYTPEDVQRFVFGPAGELLSEDSEQGGGPREYVYLEDRLLALLDHGSAGSPADWRFVGNDATARIDVAGRVVRLELAGGKTLGVTVAENAWYQYGDEAATTIRFYGRTAALEQLSGTISLSGGVPTEAYISVYVPPPRNDNFSLSAAAGATEYTGTEFSTGRSATMTVDMTTRNIIVDAEDFPAESFQVAEQNWREWNLGTFDIVVFAHVSGTKQMSGYILRQAAQNIARVTIRDGLPRYESHSLTLQKQPGGTAVYYYHNDHLGTPQALTDEAGEVAWQADYLPFGETAETVAQVDQRVRFPGQYADEEVGGYYNYQRWYEASTGRYLTSDPIGLRGGLNTYLYATANPLGFTDPTGENAIALSRGAMISLVAPIPGARVAAVALGIAAVGAVVGEMCESSDCPPCSPYPKETIGYLGPHDDHDHFPIGRPHLNLFVVNQNPKNCKCFWNKNNPDAASPPPLPGWVDLNSGFPALSP